MKPSPYAKAAAWVALAAILLGVVATVAAPLLMPHQDAAQVISAAQ